MPETDIFIRPREERDVPALAEVLKRVHTKDGYPVEGVADAEAWVQPDNEIRGWTAELARTGPVGHASLTRATEDDDAARLWQEHSGGDLTQLAIPVRLFVDPAHRARGIGRQLMFHAFEHAQSLGLAMAFDVMAKDRDAIRLYEGLGCERLGEITHPHSGGENEPAVVYVAPDQLRS